VPDVIGEMLKVLESRTRRIRDIASVIAQRSPWSQQLIVLLAYAVLSLALTWPMVRDFSTALIGAGGGKPHLWILWHTKQALLGQEPLFRTSILYYPYGTTLLTHSLGPAAGLFALPFWWLGPEAAYNGTVLIGFSLTGYCMYLLARSLGFEQSIAFFAGTVLLASPRHLAAVQGGHLTKVFLGALPLALLGLHKALDLKRSGWWAIGTASALLLSILYSGEQFVFAGIAVGFFAIAKLLEAGHANRWRLLQRGALVAASILVMTGPVLVAILLAASNPAISIERSAQSFQLQPDLVQFFVPASFTSRWVGPIFADFIDPLTNWGLETAVFLSWTGLLFYLFALVSGNRSAKRWLLFTFFCVVLALGPELLVLGENRFTNYQLPVILPYAFVTSLPGLEFLRSPGRFMLIGFVGSGVAASFGLDWLVRRFPGKLRYPIVLGAIALVLFENWPQPLSQEKLRPVPRFYQEIAQDDEQYGVFDLPIRPSQGVEWSSWHIYYSSFYQMYQMTHGKGIATGCIARFYTVHPLFGHFVSDYVNESPLQKDLLVNGAPTNRYENVQFELARNGYRYVVYHKPQDWYPEYKPGAWGELAAEQLIENVFGQQTPVVDDELVTVYKVGSITETATSLTTTIALGESTDQNREKVETGKRWVFSPTPLYVASPRLQQASLEITPGTIRDPDSGASLDGGTLMLQSGDGSLVSARMVRGRMTRLPLMLAPPSQFVTLTLQTDDPSSDEGGSSHLHFAIESIDLQTPLSLPTDISINGQPQQNRDGQVRAIHDGGWYPPEVWDDSGTTWRWAMSPSQIFLHSPTAQQVRIQSAIGSLYGPSSADGVGSQGTMEITVNDQSSQRIAVQVGQPLVVDIMLQVGWNSVAFELDAGNFRPMDIQPGNGDARLLSFALRGIDVLTN
jgi:hypothetical protein